MGVALSVMTPIYNGSAYIRRSYYLLTLQTFVDWEWVVVDDGSTDDTSELIREIQRRDSRVRLVRYEKNRGRGYARTKALEAAQGEWVVVWDVDDIYLPRRLERIDRARRAGFDFYVSQGLSADTNLKLYGLREFDEPFGPLPNRTGDHSAMAMRLDLARQVGYLPALRTVGQIGEDVPMVYQLAATARGYFDEKPSSVYVVANECFLKKSIHANTVRMHFWRSMYERGWLPMGAEEFRKLEVRDMKKLVLLNILRLCPGLYPVLMRLRKFKMPLNVKPASWEDEAFVAMIRERFSKPEQPVPVGVPGMEPEVAYAV